RKAWESIHATPLADVLMFALFAFIPLAVFWIREWLVHRSTFPRVLRSIGRWIVVLTFSFLTASALVQAWVVPFSTSAEMSALGMYRLSDGKLTLRYDFFQFLRYYGLLVFLVACIVLYWRLRVSWSRTVVRMAGVTIIVWCGALLLMTALGSALHTRTFD